MAKVKFNNADPYFFNTLKQRVEQYFEEYNIKPTGNYKLYSKTVILFLFFIAGYITLVFYTPDLAWLSVLIALLMGVNVAALGFNVMHDGAHGSYSTHKWVNEFMGYSLNFLGGNVYFWKQKHNLNHHSYTNVEGMDDDIDIYPFIRVHADQKKFWFHRFQHYYSLFLYGITYVFWVFYNDFTRYFTSKIAHFTKLRKMDLSEHLIFWISKVVYVVIFLVIPIYMTGFLNTLIAYLIMAFVAGVVLSVVFQLAHVVEDASFVMPTGESTLIENEWAKHQLETTFNFSTKSRFLSWLVGGLNFQVEHHLFPKISHIHYPNLNKIVKQTCKEFNVMYNEFPNLMSALRSHLLHLRSVGMA